jgi:hypothetical protein
MKDEKYVLSIINDLKIAIANAKSFLLFVNLQCILLEREARPPEHSSCHNKECCGPSASRKT